MTEAVNSWTAGFSKHAGQMVFAVMAANWALHGTGILRSERATTSMALCIVYLSAQLVLMGFNVYVLDSRHRYAAKNRSDWLKEFEERAGSGDSWPYTKGLERSGRIQRFLNLALPLLAGLLLLFSTLPTETRKQNPSAGVLDARSCCGQVEDDVKSIRQSVDQLLSRERSRSPVAADSFPPTIQGVTDVRVPSRLLIGVGLVLLVYGGIALWRLKSVQAQAVAAVLATVGAISISGGGLTLFKDVRFDSVVSFKSDHLIDVIQQQVTSLGASGPERIASIAGFKLGAANIVETPNGLAQVQGLQQAQLAATRWLTMRRAGKDGVLLVVGSTDRLPLRGSISQQYDANVGLARARGEAVKNAVVEACKKLEPTCDLKDEQVIVLVSGPVQTPDVADLADMRTGYPQDRRVDVWALWTKKSESAVKR
ncbi:MAG: hypothetical protein KF892_08480 [Rhizobacter sp.]|nr:hypothetical protein [Rhizobacter sp.]